MSKICKFLLNEIHFVTDRIVPCYTQFWEQEGNVEKYFIKADENTSPAVLNSYFELRKKYIEIYLKGEKPEFCKNCIYYTPTEINSDENINNIKFERIAIKERSVCNCRCVYCCLTGETDDIEEFKRINQEKYYDIKPIMEYIDKEHLMGENTQIDILGGECTEYPEELEFIANLGLKNNCKFQILTNAIIFNECIEKLLKEKNVTMGISIDSGTKEVFEKIKRVKAFDRVIENIKSYTEARKNNPNTNIFLKYILCPGYNDSLKEVKKFFALAQECKVNSVNLSIDRYWQSANCNMPVPNHIKEIVRYFAKNYVKDYDNIGSSLDYGFIYKWWADKILQEPDTINQENPLGKIKTFFRCLFSDNK